MDNVWETKYSMNVNVLRRTCIREDLLSKTEPENRYRQRSENCPRTVLAKTVAKHFLRQR